MATNYKDYLKTISTHKKYVNAAAKEAGIPMQGLTHDMSKYSPKEFFAYAKKFNGDDKVKSDPKTKENFQKAWKHHYTHNPHHYQYWDNGDGTYKKMPYRYVKEMVCDWIGAGKAYSKSDEPWTTKEPLKWFDNAISSSFIKLNPQTERICKKILVDYAKIDQTGETLKSILDKYEKEYGKADNE